MPMIVKAFAYDACHVPKPLIYNCDINEKIGRKPAGSHAASTVMNTWNGRCETTFCLVLSEIALRFTQLSGLFNTIKPPFSPDFFL